MLFKNSSLPNEILIPFNTFLQLLTIYAQSKCAFRLEQNRSTDMKSKDSPRILLAACAKWAVLAVSQSDNALDTTGYWDLKL